MQKEYDKQKKKTRISISDRDLEEWGIGNVNDKVIRKWIKQGQSNENLDLKLARVTEKIEIIDDKLDRFIKMMGYFGHHSYLQSELAPIKKELLPEEFNNRLKEKNMLSFKVRHKFFPEFRIRSNESDLDQWLKEQEGD